QSISCAESCVWIPCATSLIGCSCVNSRCIYSK
uniref:Acyclotide phyb-M n=1 Tax=Petunia hybrida TaxID=4102 RepID=CYCM_PETHY|nr:RecName: Full=Acyclotide phyb-M [Petunia x hybrida]